MPRKKIIVAGSGHGGLCAAILLAREGYNVTVFEEREKSELGYDWEDCIYLPEFDFAGLRPPEKMLKPFFNSSYLNPAKTVKLTDDAVSPERLRSVDRKDLIAFLIDEAEKAGAEFRFSEKVLSAKCLGNKVAGIVTEKGEYESDLVIDAAGMFSSVRASLPAGVGILRNLPENNVIYTYRAYYRNTGILMNNPRQTTYFFHCKRPGMDWFITLDGYIDILLGGFYPLTQGDVDEALQDFENDFSFSKNDRIRGGSFNAIPLGKVIPKFVCDGYAAIGDSASMVEPMSGSGLGKCMCAGKMLADTVISAGDYELTTERLWRFEKDYFRSFGRSSFSDYTIMSMLKGLKAEDIDYFFEKGILNQSVLKSKNFKDFSAWQIINVGISLAKKPHLLSALAFAGLKLSLTEKATLSFPERYKEDEFEKWLKIYNRI